MTQQRAGERGDPDVLRSGSTMNQGNSEDIGTTAGSQRDILRGSGVTPRRKVPGKITLGGETSWVTRDLRDDGHDTEEDSVAFRTYWRRASMG